LTKQVASDLYLERSWFIWDVEYFEWGCLWLHQSLEQIPATSTSFPVHNSVALNYWTPDSPN